MKQALDKDYKMYMYIVVILALSGLTLVNTRDLHAPMNRLSYRRVHRALSHVNTTGVQGPPSCEVTAFKCYEPILSYIDGDGELCGWKNMTSLFTLPDVCMDIEQFTMIFWGDQILKNEYRFYKTCSQIKIFQQCVTKNQCGRDRMLNYIMSEQNIFCVDLQVILPVHVCKNAWDSSVNWYKLVYTDWRIVQACPATLYTQLALNSVKLFIFTYVTFPSSQTVRVVMSVNAEAAGRYICQSMQQDLCWYKRGDAVCNGYLPMQATQGYYYPDLLDKCESDANNFGKCNAIVNWMCPINYTTGYIAVKGDLADIRNMYNMTYWHSVGDSEVDILLHTDNKDVGHCDAGNLIFKQLGCFHQYMVQIDINHANHINYLTGYMCSRIKHYNACFETYISSPCPDEAKQFQGIGNFLHAQCDILKIANKNVTCPLFAVYSKVVFISKYWFGATMQLMQQYMSVIKCIHMDPEPSGWRDQVTYNAEILLMMYNTVFTKAAKIRSTVNYHYDVISTVCDQETADVYKDFVTLSTGKQYYQLMNHVIKGFEYIILLAK